MKTLLLFPSIYTLGTTFSSGLKNLGFEVSEFDYRSKVKSWKNTINTQMYRLPFNIRSKWNNSYMGAINKVQIENYNKVYPDIVVIYNNEMLFPETVKYFSKRSKIIFYLGDNPFYTPTNDYFLDLLFMSDLIISPDSFWKQQLELMGINNCVTEYFYTQKEKDNQVIDEKIESHDLLFVGMSYVNSWGYKRALFLSKFADMDIRIHGNSSWYRWLEFFPELKPKFILKSNYSENYMAQLHAHAKIYPYDSNPGLLNGIHVRIFDCIDYGVLPIPEYRADLEQVFKNQNLPIIYDYKKAKEVADYYLRNDSERIELVNSLQKFLENNYKPEISLARIISKIDEKS